MNFTQIESFKQSIEASLIKLIKQQSGKKDNLTLNLKRIWKQLKVNLKII